VYLAAPLFSDAERAYNRQVAALLRNHFFEVFLPQDSSDNEPGRDRGTHSRIYESNRQALEDADVVVAIIDGADADSGTAWEMGYAAARQKPVIALRTDFRMAGHHEHVNLMLEQSARITRNAAELLAALGAPPAGNQVP
jgi:nucleoside 2-deoxyribosyltransferase